MAAMAGALGVRLEKVGHYVLGDPADPPSADHIFRAVKVMKLACILFAASVAAPISICLFALGVPTWAI